VLEKEKRKKRKKKEKILTLGNALESCIAVDIRRICIEVTRDMKQEFQ
jgi:hypothetical protein